MDRGRLECNGLLTRHNEGSIPFDPTMENLKKCSRCRIPKYLYEFGVSKSAKDGLQSKCIICNRDQAKRYYHEVKQRIVHGERAKFRRGRIAFALAEIKIIAGCRFCQEKCSVCLDFHHASEDKEFGLARCVFAMSKIKQEIVKCEVICSNCHRKVHAGLLEITEVRILDLSPLEDLISKTRRYQKHVEGV